MQLASNIPDIILATLMLILFVVATAAAFVGVFWLIYRGSTLFYKWLSQHKFFIGFRRKCQEWWSRNRVSVIKFWELISVLIDPVFYGYVLVTLYQRVQAINEYAETHQQYSPWQLLNTDMESHMQYYIVLVIIFFVWLLAQVWKHNKQVESDRNISKKLDRLLDGIESSNKGLSESTKQNSEDIKRLTGSIERLADEIRKDREDKHGKSPSDL